MLTGLASTTALAALGPARAVASAAADPAPGPAPTRPAPNQALDVISVARLAAAAKLVLPAGAYAYIHDGVGDQWTLAQNEAALRELPFRPHRLAGFSRADLTMQLLGQPYPLPFYVCPMGAQDFAHPQAELASAAGAAAAGVLYVLSSASNKPLEAVAQASGSGPRWFALYLNTDPAVNRHLAQRARVAGYSALVMTVDSLGPGQSDAYLALGSPKSPTAGFGNFDPRFGGQSTFTNLKKDFVPADIRLLREASGELPVLVKGILRPEDATRCLDAGAAGLIVSNHGGRTLDGAPASIRALPGIVQAVGGRVPVLFDSGVRRGIDAVRALALGATAVGIGRPVLYGLALGGAAGVRSVLDYFQRDLAAAMLLVGAPTVRELKPDFLEPAGYAAGAGR